MSRTSLRAVTIACAIILDACSGIAEAPSALGSQQSALLPYQSGQGFGPNLYFVCQTSTSSTAGSTYDCGATVNSKSTLVSALTPPGLAFASSTQGPNFPYVYSWNAVAGVNLWDYDQSGVGLRNRGAFYDPLSGPTAIDLNARALPVAGLTPIHFGAVLSGFLIVPPSGSDTLKSFAIGANDGSFFAIQGCTNNPCDGALSTFTLDDTAGSHALTFSTTKVLFPASGGLFPFVVGWVNNAAQTGLELAWQDGDVTGTPPAVSDTGQVTNTAGWTLIPASSIASPDVRGSLSVIGTPTPNQNLTFTATIANLGTSPAYPVSGASGLSYQLALPGSVLGTGSIQSVTVNGQPVTPTITSSGQNTLVTTSFTSPGQGALMPGQANQVTITVVAKLSASAINGVQFQAQGLIRGEATDPAFQQAALGAPQTLWVLTNDPSRDDGIDDGNAPPMTGSANEGGVGGTYTFVSAAMGGGDDDPTTFVIGTAAPSAPTITSPTGNVSTATATSFSGTATAGSTVRAALTNVAQADCGAASWSWDAAAQICSCQTTVSSGTIWSCGSLPLSDCPSSACYTLTVGSVDASGAKGPVNQLSFGTAAPTATVTSPANGSTLNSSSVTPSGTATNGLGATPNGMTVDVTVTGPNGFFSTCVATTGGGNGAWTCTALPLPGDGAYSITARVGEANGNDGPPSSSGFTVAAPTITSPADGKFTNTATGSALITFSGTKDATSTAVRVCKTATACAHLSAGEVCQTSPSANVWSCSVSVPAGSATFHAFEISSSGNAGSASNGVTVTINNSTATVNVGAGAVFNLSSANPYALSGSCAGPDGANTVTAKLMRGGGGWPSGSPATCSASCQSGTWSCNLPLPSAQSTGVSLVISQRAADASTSPDLTVGSITVDRLAPSAATLNAISNVNAAAPNPPAVSGGGEPGASVTVIVRDSSNAVAGTCSAIASGATWSCTQWSGLNGGNRLLDGAYVASVTQTDSAGNAQTASANTASFMIDTVAPNKPSIDSPANGATVSTTTVDVLVTPTEGNGSLAIRIKDAAGTVVGSCVLTVPATATQQTCTVNNLLQGATYSVEAVQTDAAGNVDATNGTQVSSFLVQAAPPAITDATPLSGPSAGGTIVTLTGSGFRSGATVDFGGTQATSVSVDSPTQITTMTPAHAPGTASITVTNSDAQSATFATPFVFEAPDAGTPDAGATDAGAAVDAGVADGGNVVDGGVVQDGGSSPDAGSQVDSGFVQDAGASVDAGAEVDAGGDAGSPADAGFGSDAGSDSPDDADAGDGKPGNVAAGCGCQSGPAASGWFMLAAIGLAWAARRRRS